MTTVRRAAADVLLAVGRGRTTLATALDRARGPFADRRDRALLVELTMGPLRWRNALDRVIERASRRRIGTIDEPALAVLRVGAYQLAYLTRVPPHAVVNESVEAVRGLGSPRAASFVNAVLRKITRVQARAHLPARPDDRAPRDRWIEYLTVTLSHPAWLVERWVDRHGLAATDAWCTFNNATPDVAVRLRSPSSAETVMEAGRAIGVEIAPGRQAPAALRLPPGALSRLPAEIQAQIHIQDEGSQLVANAAGARRGERVIDLCASPGGKTVVMAEAMGRDGGENAAGLVASDYRPARVALLAQTLEAAGKRVPIVRLDAQRPLPFAAVFDAVLLDAPCSGLGTLSRDPDLKWSRTAEQLPDLAAGQRRMLAAAAEIVRPGGRLIYATCSSEPEENALVVDAFLEADGRFTLEPFASDLVPARLLDDRGRLATLPFRDGIDAFFAARLVRRNGT